MYRFLHFDKKFNRIKEDLINSKEHKYGPSGKLMVSAAGGASANPWIHIQKARRKWCHYYWKVYSQKAGLIPEFCRYHCWKVMVSLTMPPTDEMPTGRFGTIQEVMMLYNLMKMLNLPSKIGMDVRPYTYGVWRAYFYGDTLEEAREYYEIVKPHIERHFEPGIGIVITRGCTEMNAKLQSRYWDMPAPEEEQKLEKKLNDLLEFEEFDWQQAEQNKQATKEWWIETAIQIGDPTVKAVAEELTGDPDIWKRLVVHSDNYHLMDPRENLLQSSEPGKMEPGDMLNHFDNTVQKMELTNEEVTEFLKSEAVACGIADCMEIMDEMITSGDPAQIEAFLTKAKEWSVTRTKPRSRRKAAKKKAAKKKGGKK